MALVFTGIVMIFFGKYDKNKYYCSMKSRAIKRLAWIAGILAFLVIALKVVLSPRVLTPIINKVAAEYVEGDVNFSKVKVSILRSFPHLNLTLEETNITYPHERYARYDSLLDDGIARRRFSLVRAGLSEEGTDTLASFRSASFSVNYLSLIGGRIHVRNAELVRPRIFVHVFDSTRSNLDILPLGGDDEDTTSTTLPPITIRRVCLDQRPLVVYTNPSDTLYGMVTMKQFLVSGKIMTDDIPRSRVGLDLDSMFVSGRLPADTVAFALDHLGLHGKRERLDLDARAKAFLATGSYGRLRVPLSLDATASMPERDDDALEVNLESLEAGVATVLLKAAGSGVVYSDSIRLDARAGIEKTSVADLLDFLSGAFPELGKVHTNATLSLDATCDGVYVPETDELPPFNLDLSIPLSKISHDELDRSGKVRLAASVMNKGDGIVSADIRDLAFRFAGLSLNARGGAIDLLGADPIFSADGTFRASVDSLTRAFTAESGITGTGALTGRIKGRMRQSQTDLASIGKADLECSVNADTLDITLDGDMFIRGGDFGLSAKTAKGALKGALTARNLMVRDDADLDLRIRNSTEEFKVVPPSGKSKVPYLSLNGKHERIGLRQDALRLGIKGASYNLAATKNARTAALKNRRKHFLDSLQRVYPGVPRDSLIQRMMRSRTLPDYLQDASLREHDINISLDESLAKYWREWDLNGKLEVERGFLSTPSFPLRNRIEAVSGSFNNDRVDLHNLTVRSGVSDVSGKCSVTGLRRALLGRGLLKLDAAISSDYIDANELMRAYALGQTLSGSVAEVDGDVSDEEYQDRITEAGELPDSVENALLVIPANLNAEISLEANRIKYDSLMVTWAAADIAMRKRTLQITNTVATSNMGDIYFEGFYSTKTRKDVKAGFDLNMVDITAEKVIQLFPAVDTIMPILKSFAGYLDCELAATSSIDEGMNLVLPSVDGIMRISGKDLTLQDNEQFTKIARLLLFRNYKKGTIDKMTVNGMIRNNTLEIFPFVLKLDRYTLAASGIQHLDESFKYHISAIRTPLLVKFGINVYGSDFDHMKFGIGRALYRNTDVPVFTQQLNDVQINLVNSIHHVFDIGVEKAIEENRQQTIVEQEKDKLKYNSDFDTSELKGAELDSLNVAKQKFLEEEAAEEAAETKTDE